MTVELENSNRGLGTTILRTLEIFRIFWHPLSDFSTSTLSVNYPNDIHCTLDQSFYSNIILIFQRYNNKYAENSIVQQSTANLEAGLKTAQSRAESSDRKVSKNLMTAYIESI